MLDTGRTAPYFKVQGPDKPGEAARCLGALEAADVNLLAFLAFPQKRRSQLDCVPSDPTACKAAAKQAKWKIQGPKTCFVVGRRRGSRRCRREPRGQARQSEGEYPCSCSDGRGSWTLWLHPVGQAKGC